MRVLFVSHVSSKYGAGRSLLALIDGLTDKGVTSCVVLPREGPLGTEFAERHVAHSVMPVKNWASRNTWAGKRVLRACFNLLVTVRVAAIARSWQADVIYTNSSVTPVGAFAALLTRKPHIWHAREFGKEDYSITFDLGFRRSARLMESLSSRVIVISEALRSKYAQYVSSRSLKVIYNPVGVAAETRLLGDSGGALNADPNKIPTAAIVGIIHPAKGQMDAVLAVAELAQEGIEVNLKIVGNGEPDYLNRLRDVVIENDIEECVEFTGFVDDPLSIMQAADMVLVCSRSEAFGRVTIESMFSGTPVVGARSGATPELVLDGFNGLLYEQGDHKDLAGKMKRLILCEEEAKQMGRKGFQWASERFTVDRYADAVFDVLQAAIHDGSGDAGCAVQR